jgi:hypothetical protein
MAEFAGFAATPRPPRGRPEAAAPAPSRHWHSPGSARKPSFIRCSELEIFLVNSSAFNSQLCCVEGLENKGKRNKY